ncbi:MAG: hypothetical protein M3Y08_17025 [Fibrobacterota bacterium]|nr:hypothetical protein [Fibrobacterota bacterium]
MIARVQNPFPQNLILSSKLGLVSVPAAGESVTESIRNAPGFDRDEARVLLQALGRNLGMTLLEPKEDVFPEEGSAQEATAAFPDEAIRKTLEALDVVWLKGNEVVAVFAVETGVGAWEGVRRVADLLALHPKSKAALYVVSQPAFKAGMLTEISRPVYRLLKKPLGESVRLLDWTRLESEVGELGERVRYLKPEFLEGISEVVEPPAGE